MGICKSCSLTIPTIDTNFELKIATQQDACQYINISKQLSVSQSVPLELQNQGNQNQITNNNKQYNQNPIEIKQVDSLWKSQCTEKNKKSDGLQNHIQMQQIDELSKSLLRNDIPTQPDDNTDRLVTKNNHFPELMLVSNQQKMSDNPRKRELILISHDLVVSNHSSPKNKIEKQSL